MRDSCQIVVRSFSGRQLKVEKLPKNRKFEVAALVNVKSCMEYSVNNEDTCSSGAILCLVTTSRVSNHGLR